MPPFEYRPYRNPYVNSISDLMERQGQIPAQAAQQIGNAQAQAALQSGQAWAGAANQIGQGISGAIQQAIDPRRKIEAMQAQALQGQLADTNALRRGHSAVDAMMAGDQLSAGAAGPRQESYLDSSGLFDVPKLTQALASGGLGHMAPELLKGAEQINDSILKHQDLEQKAAQQHALMVGDMADGALKLAKIGMPIPAAMDFVSQPALATKRIQPQEYQQIRQQIASLPPEQQSAALTAFMDQAAKLDKGETLPEGAIHADRYGRTNASGAAKPMNETQLFADAATLGTPQETPTAKNSAVAAAMLKPKPKLDLQAKPDMVIKGTTNVPSFDPQSGKYMFNGQEVAADQVVRAAPPKDPVAVALQNIALQTAQAKLTETQQRHANVAAIADGMKNGTIPPDPEGLSRQGIYADVIGKMAQDGVDFTELRKQWLASKRLSVTENSPQSVRLDIAVRSGLKMYDAIDGLATQWDGMGLGPLSRANLKLAMEGGKGQAAAQLATQLNGQIAQLTSDVATVEQNGMTPTQESRHVAEQSMQSWWSNGTIHAMTAQGRANMKIRENARNESVPLVPGQQQPAAGLVPTGRYNPATGKVEPIKQ